MDIQLNINGTSNIDLLYDLKKKLNPTNYIEKYTGIIIKFILFSLIINKIAIRKGDGKNYNCIQIKYIR